MTAAHLGGYVPGGDPATLYPDLWDWMVDTLSVRSVVDVGCGDGAALRHFRNRGCRAVGIDGVPQLDPDIRVHDYTAGPLELADSFDLCWCCEFVEHVDEWHMPNFLATFRSARLLALTHAEPGQAGHHHVNCRTGDYWLGALAAAGFRHEQPLTRLARIIAAVNPSPWNHFARSGLILTRCD